nr:NTP transferase domain-containing protein [Alphaproteobacteria bacterium]
MALLAVVILAAGKGQRMQSSLPKVLHPVAGWPMLRHVMNTAIQLKPSQLAVVVGPNMQNVADVAFPWPTVIQDKQLGTGHAVQVGLSALQNIANHDVLVIYGDCPLVTAETLENMRRIFDQAQGQQQPVG